MVGPANQQEKVQKFLILSPEKESQSYPIPRQMAIETGNGYEFLEFQYWQRRKSLLSSSASSTHPPKLALPGKPGHMD